MTLRLWSWPMKCQRNAPGYAVAFASRSWARFSPTSVIPASASVPISSSGTYLTAARTSTRVRQLRADAREVLAHAAGVEAGDQTRHTTPAWRPVTPPSRRWEKNRPSQHIVHRPTSCTVATPASRARRAAIGREVEVALAAAGSRSRRTPRAPPRRPRSSSRGRPGRSARSPGRAAAARAAPRRPRPRCRRPAPRQPACSAATAPSPASSTGRQSAVNTSAGWPVSAVAWPSSSAGGRAGPGGSVARRTVAPCTWRPYRKRSRGQPVAAATRSRFSSTLAPSSSVSRPRLREANGPVETPPRRVVNSARAPGRPAATWSPSQWKGARSCGSVAGRHRREC